MTSTMEALIKEATKKINEEKRGYGFAHADVDGKDIRVRLLEVNTNGRQFVQNTWYVDGKRVAAAKVLAM